MADRSRTALALLAAALVCGAGIRLVGMAVKQGYVHDETISYLAATGNQVNWASARDRLEYPFAAWAPVADWQRLYTSSEETTLRCIASDLTLQDTHPPLYFWLLHYAVAAFGIHPWTGPALNLVLALATVLALYGLAGAAGMRSYQAALASFIWAVSPAAVFTSAQARHYELFALTGLAFVWLLIRAIDERAGGRLATFAALSVVTTLGLLTHFYFALVVASAVLAVLLTRATPRCRTALAIGLALIVGAGLLFAVHPHFWRSFAWGRHMVVPFSWSEMPGRLRVVAYTLGSFVTVSRRIATALVALLAAGVVSALALRRPSRSWIARQWNDIGPRLRVVLASGGLLLAMQMAIYLSFLSPEHAFGLRYMSPVWPFLAIGVTLVFTRMRGHLPSLLAFALPVLLLASSLAATLRYQGPAFRPMIPTQIIHDADRILVDTSARGALLRVLLHARADTKVFAAEQAHLLSHTRDWLPQIRAGDLYVSMLPEGNTLKMRQEIAALLGKKHEVGVAHGALDGYTVAYGLGPAVGEGP